MPKVCLILCFACVSYKKRLTTAEVICYLGKDGAEISIDYNVVEVSLLV